MKAAATIYGRIEDNRVDDLLGECDELTRDAIAPALAEKVRIVVSNYMREAYRRGVVDGFAQGVAAEDDG